ICLSQRVARRALEPRNATPRMPAALPDARVIVQRDLCEPVRRHGHRLRQAAAQGLAPAAASAAGAFLLSLLSPLAVPGGPGAALGVVVNEPGKRDLVRMAAGEPGSILFGLARFSAVTSEMYRHDTVLPRADRELLAEQYASRAVKLLEGL